MGLVSSKELCKRSEVVLQQISNGLYEGVEHGNNTYNTAKVLEMVSSEVASEVSMNARVAPGDVTCASVKATVKIEVPDCSDNTCTNLNFDCSAPAATAENYVHDEMLIQDMVCDEFSVSAELYDCSCEDPLYDLARKLKRSARKMYAQYNEKLASKMVAAAGVSYNGVETAINPLALKIFTDSCGELKPQPMGFFALSAEYDNQAPNRNVNPVVITGSQMFKAYDFSKPLYEGNDQGRDSNRTTMEGIYYDPAFAKVLQGGSTNNPAFSFLPGSLHLLEYFDFGRDGYKGTRIGGGSFFDGMVKQEKMVRTVMDIGTNTIGVPFLVDAQIRYDECAGKYGTVTYKFKKTFDLYNTNQAAMCPDKPFNYKLLWDVQCAPFGCSDINNEPAPAPTPDPTPNPV